MKKKNSVYFVAVVLLFALLLGISACDNIKEDKDNDKNTDKQYTVTFQDYDGRVLKIEYVQAGNDATPPAEPHREYYSFSGWSEDFTNITKDIVIVAQYEEGSVPRIVIGSAEANPGDTVELSVTLSGNPGILGMTLNLNFDDSALTLKKITRGSALSELTFTKPKGEALVDGCRLPWDGEEVLPEDITNGEIATFTFEISDNASPGDYAISLSYKNGQIIDNNMNTINVVVSNGNIKVK